MCNYSIALKSFTKGFSEQAWSTSIPLRFFWNSQKVTHHSGVFPDKWCSQNGSAQSEGKHISLSPKT